MSIGIPVPLNRETRAARGDAAERGLCFDCAYSNRIEGRRQSYYSDPLGHLR